MRTTVEVRLKPGDRERFEVVVADGNSPQKHAWRAGIILLSGSGVGTMAIARRTGLAAESGTATPMDDELRRLDRARKGKKVPNAEWTSPSDPEARITRMKDGRTRLAYKPEHAVDLDTGAVMAAHVHPDVAGDTTMLPATLARAEEALAAAGAAPSAEAPAELVADKGYHARDVLRAVDDGPLSTRIHEPKRTRLLRWRGNNQARQAVYNNRARLLSGVAKSTLALRVVPCERAFTHILDRGRLRRTWLRGRANVAAHNLGLLMRALIGFGAPKAAAEALNAIAVYLHDGEITVLFLLAARHGQPFAAAGIIIAPQTPPLSTAC